MNGEGRSLDGHNPRSFGAFLVVVFCLIAVFQLATIRPGMLNEDSALYLLNARNIAFGRPCVATGYIYTTAEYSPWAYVPVLPLMLAPLYRFSGVNPGPYKLLIVSILVLCILAIALFYREKIGPPYLMLLLMLFGFNPYITGLKNDILLDIPFLLFLYVALLVFGDAPLLTPFTKLPFRLANAAVPTNS